jgi:hypothetical protein
MDGRLVGFVFIFVLCICTIVLVIMMMMMISAFRFWYLEEYRQFEVVMPI